MYRDEDTAKKVGVAFLVGAVTGWLISLFMPDETRKKVKDEIEEKTNYLKRVMTDPDERERIKEIFSEKTQDAGEKIQQVKEDVIKRLSALKGGVEKIDRDKYFQAVKDSIDDMRRGGVLPKDELQKLSDYLERDYDRIRRKMRRS